MTASDPPNDDLIDAASMALFQLGRVVARQPMPRPDDARGVELSRIMVVQAIEQGSEDQGSVSVGQVATRLGVDPSTASRLVSDAIRDRYVERVAGGRDARRVGLELTDQGRILADAARRYQRTVFAQVTRDWTDEERRTFAALFVRFVRSVGDVHDATK